MKEKTNKSGFGPTGPWFRMPREIATSSELTPYQYQMLSLLLERDDYYQSTKGKTWFYCYLDWFETHCGMCKTKVKKTLNELEEMGFISITRQKDTRLANRFHINWNNINTYKRPLTEQELEGMEDPDAYGQEMKAAAAELDALAAELDAHREGTAPVATPVLKDLDVDLDATLEDRRKRCPETSAKPPSYDTASVQSSTLPSAAEWYQSVGKETLYGTDFPYLYGLTLDQKNEQVFENYVAEMMNRVLPQVKENDAWSVWKSIVSPGCSEYMKEQKQQNEQSV